MSDFQSILDEADDEIEASTTSTEPAVAEPAGEATPEPAVEARTGEEPAPDGGANTAATPAPAPITRDDGATWSEKAQRWYKDGKIVSGEAPAKVEQAPQAPTAPEAVVAPEAPKPETPIAEPFTFRANGQKHAIPGLVVPPEQQELVRGLLVDGVNHRQNFGRMQAEWKGKLAQAEQAGAARGEKYNKASVYLFDKVQQLLADHPNELEMTRRELALMLKEADLSVPKAMQAEPEIDEQQLEQGARATLSGYLQELFEDTPGASILSDEDKKDLADAFQARLAAYFEEQNGEIMLDTHAAKRDFDRELKIAQRAQQARETAVRDAQKAKAAAAFNAAQQPVVPKPPTSPKPKPALAAAPSGTPAKSWDQRVKDIWKDDDED